MSTQYEPVGPLVTISWSGSIRLRSGEKIKVIGEKTGEQSLKARIIFDESGAMHEGAGTHEQPQSEPTPLIARVVTSRAYGDRTLVEAFPLESRAFFFNGLAAQQPFLLVPEFWAFLEDRADWEQQALRPFDPILREDVELEPLDLREPSRWLQLQCERTGANEPIAIGISLGVINKKLSRVERLARKTIALDDLRRHLIACSPSSRREWALEETLEEGAMLLEQASAAVYSTLDVFAHLVNLAYRLEIPDMSCGFTALFGRPAAMARDVPISWKPLPTDEPLHELLSSARTEWIDDLRSLRHFVAHKGYVLEGGGPSAKAIASWQSDFQDLRSFRILPVQATVGEWANKLRSLMGAAMGLMGARAETICSEISVTPDPPKVQPASKATSPADLISDCVRLLQCSTEKEPDRISFLYSKVNSTWKRRWPRAEFESYINALSDIEYAAGAMHSMGVAGAEENAECHLRGILNGRPVRLVLEARKTGRNRPSLVLTPLSWPQDCLRAIDLAEVSVRQSGPETGHGRAIFTVKVVNLSEQSLEDVHVHVFESDVRWADCEIGTLNPAEERIVEFSTSDAVSKVFPPAGPALLVCLLHDPLCIRLTYTRPTTLGRLWADDFITGGLTGGPPRLRSVK